MRVECDADTRKVAERHVRRVNRTIHNALRGLVREPGDALGYASFIRSVLAELVTAIDAAPFEPCGWTGDVEDPVAWTCPACLAEHATPEPDGERDVSPADAAYYADRAADRYEQRLYGGA